MKLARALWARLDGVQQTLAAKITLSIVALVVVSTLAGVAFSQAQDAHRRFMGVVMVLQEANIVEENAATVQLIEKGEVEVDGIIYGDERFAAYASSMFDEETGRLVEVALLGALLIAQHVPEWIPATIVDTPSLALWIGFWTLLWLLLVVWSDVSLPVAAAAFGTAAACGVVWLASVIGLTDEPIKWVLAVLGVGVLGTTFLLAIRVVLAMLGAVGAPRPRPGRHGHATTLVQICAVAHVLIRESVRQRISLSFIVVLLICLPLIPLWIDPSEPLRYQVQNFLSDSMTLVYVLAACMTLMLACASVAFEIRDRQIWQLMTKPMGRLEYLLGKWLGLLLLNVILLGIGGVSIFSFTEYLRTRPTADPLDAIAVTDEVLTARVGVLPVFDNLTADEVRRRVDTEIDNNAVLKDEIATGEKRGNDVRRLMGRQVRKEHLYQQRAVSPTEFSDGQAIDAKTFVFRGLGRARAEETNITLRYEFHIGRSESTDHYPVVFSFPDVGERVEQVYVPAQWHSMLVPASWIGEDGSLRVQILNGGFSDTPSEATLMFFANGATLYFDADGMEVMWQAASFETNFLRAMVVLWVKLAFLAALGIAASTFLSFPVGVLLAFSVFVGGSLAPFIAMSVEEYRIAADTAWPIRMVQWCIVGIAQSAEWMLRPFGEANPTTLVIEGRLVGLGGVVRNILQIGVFWCGLVLFIGWWVFRRRELATYSGQG